MAKRLPFDQFKTLYSQVTRLSVDLLVLTPQGLALTKRAIPPGEGKWHIPGGTVLYGETIPEAIQRIGQDELGITVKLGPLVGYIQYPQASQELGWGWPIGFAFVCEHVSGTYHGGEQGPDIAFFKDIPPHTLPDQVPFLETVFNLRAYYRANTEPQAVQTAR